MKIPENIKVIAFDADDTLWVNEPYFRGAEDRFTEWLTSFADKETITSRLFKTEIQNLELYGYGVKAFTLSMIETASNIAGNQLTHQLIEQILELGKSILNQPVELLPRVEDVLKQFSEKFRLVVATKGDLLDQERKLKKSGIEKYFHHVEIMSDKQTGNYRSLLKHLDIQPVEFMMIGNSMKSDIIPVLEIGSWAVHIPYHITWQHETVHEKDLPQSEMFSELTQMKELLAGQA